MHIRRKVTLLDMLILAGLACLGSYIAYRLSIELEYTWNWGVIPQYILRFDAETGAPRLGLLTLGFLTTIKLSILATVSALIIGTSVGLLRSSRSLFRKLNGTTYVGMVRNIPPLILVFIFYFFVSEQIIPALGLEELIRNQSEPVQSLISALLAPPGRISSFLAAVVSLALYEGAYIAEIVRAGIASVDTGQWEASAAIGLTRRQQLRKVILPQAFQRIIPSLAGQFISTIKDSAIVSIISIQELTFQGMELMAATYRTFEVWITITVMYFILTFSCSMLTSRLEFKLQKKYEG